ncbi:MAG: hypothetical protein IKJ65_12100 [Clostridia bacterium]|nr:hypothetical protein [Clostridia bacterium]
MTMEMLLKALKGHETVQKSVPLELRPSLPKFIPGESLTAEVFYYASERENGEFFLCAPEMRILWDAQKAEILSITPLPGGERIGSMQDALKGPTVKKQKEYIAFGDQVLSGKEAPDDEKWLSSMGEAFSKWYKN